MDAKIGLIYDSSRRPHPFWEELREAYRYRDLIIQLVSRDVKTRYKRSLLGIAWTMLNPLLMMIVLALVFSNLFRVAVPHYALYLLAGLVCWNFVAQTTTTASNVMRAGAPLLNKVYLPRTVFALTAIGTGIVNLLLSFVPLFAIALAMGVTPTWSLLWLVPAVVVTAAFALGLGLLLCTLAVPFPDVIEMYQVLLTAWYFLTPIIYPEEMVSAEFRAWLVVNPMHHIVKLFRDPVHLGLAPTVDAILFSVVSALAMLVIGWYAFSTRADDLANRV